MTKDNRIQTVEAVVWEKRTNYISTLSLDNYVHILGKNCRTLHHIVHNTKDYSVVRHDTFRKPFDYNRNLDNLVAGIGGVLIGTGIMLHDSYRVAIGLAAAAISLRDLYLRNLFDRKIKRGIMYDDYIKYKKKAHMIYDELAAYKENGEFDRIHGKFYIT